MKASLNSQYSPGTLALGRMRAIDLADDGPGLFRLALMVGTVFGRLTALDDGPSEAKSRK